jgi:hypothetical protein
LEQKDFFYHLFQVSPFIVLPLSTSLLALAIFAAYQKYGIFPYIVIVMLITYLSLKFFRLREQYLPHYDVEDHSCQAQQLGFNVIKLLRDMSYKF